MPATSLYPSDSFLPEDIPPGTKMVYRQRITTFIDGQEIGFSILVVRGQKEGKTLIVCAGIHGDEYEGVVAIQECFRELDPSQIRGTLMGVPIVNEPAFTRISEKAQLTEKTSHVFSRGIQTAQSVNKLHLT